MFLSNECDKHCHFMRTVTDENARDISRTGASSAGVQAVPQQRPLSRVVSVCGAQRPR